MRAAISEGDGRGFHVEELREPQPGPGEVSIDVRACGVCHTDLHVLDAGIPFPSPCVLGHEVAGTIRALGSGVDDLEVGQRVACSFIMPCGRCRHCVRGLEDLCEAFFDYNRLRGVLYDGNTRLFRPDGDPVWMYSMGGLAEVCVVPATDVFPVPEVVDLSDAAVLGCSVFTAYGATQNVARLTPSDAVAVVAIGGVGANIVRFAAMNGARQVIAIDVSEAKLDMARALGATDVVNAANEDVAGAVRSLTGDRGVDVAFEALGHPGTVETALSITDDGGRVVLVGISGSGDRAALDITRVVRRKLEIRGSYGGRARTDMPRILELAEGGHLPMGDLISRRYSLDEVNDAYDALRRGEIVGRAVIEM